MRRVALSFVALSLSTAPATASTPDLVVSVDTVALERLTELVLGPPATPTRLLAAAFLRRTLGFDPLDSAEWRRVGLRGSAVSAVLENGELTVHFPGDASLLRSRLRNHKIRWTPRSVATNGISLEIQTDWLLTEARRRLGTTCPVPKTETNARVRLRLRPNQTGVDWSVRLEDRNIGAKGTAPGGLASELPLTGVLAGLAFDAQALVVLRKLNRPPWLATWDRWTQMQRACGALATIAAATHAPHWLGLFLAELTNVSPRLANLLQYATHGAVLLQRGGERQESLRGALQIEHRREAEPDVRVLLKGLLGAESAGRFGDGPLTATVVADKGHVTTTIGWDLQRQKKTLARWTKVNGEPAIARFRWIPQQAALSSVAPLLWSKPTEIRGHLRRASNAFELSGTALLSR